MFFFFCFLEKGQKGSNDSSTSTDYGEDEDEQNWFYKLWNENVDADDEGDEGDEGELTFYIYIYLHL